MGRIGETGIAAFSFGERERRLFGCYHPPVTEAIPNSAVILCYPMGHEYIQFHRAFRQLAVRLSQSGFPVFRFDFYGCGDSAGEPEDAKIRDWLADVNSAITEAKERTGASKVSLVGLRLGGTLSALTGAERGDIEALVLWDPVVNGRRYLKDLKDLHQRMLRFSHVKPRHYAGADSTLEILGFPLTNGMLAELQDLDLLAIQQKPSKEALVVESTEEPGEGLLQAHLAGLGVQVQHQRLPSPELWTWVEDFGRMLVPHQIIHLVVSWLTGLHR